MGSDDDEDEGDDDDKKLAAKDDAGEDDGGDNAEDKKDLEKKHKKSHKKNKKSKKAGKKGKSTPGVRDSFGRENLMTEGNGVGASKPLGDGEPKRFARVYSFTGMARRGGARVFYDEKPPLAMNSC